MNDRTRTSARGEWNAARPVTAMRLLADAGMSSKQRRAVLVSWGVFPDDAIDFASDSYIL